MITGRNSSGSITSRERVFTAIVENSVPTAAIPSVVSNAAGNNPGCSSEKLYNTANTGNATISIASINSRLPSILPKKITSRPTGASISACIPPLSFSSASERFSPSAPPNVNATQSMPGATNATV